MTGAFVSTGSRETVRRSRRRTPAGLERGCSSGGLRPNSAGAFGSNTLVRARVARSKLLSALDFPDSKSAAATAVAGHRSPALLYSGSVSLQWRGRVTILDLTP